MLIVFRLVRGWDVVRDEERMMGEGESGMRKWEDCIRLRWTAGCKSKRELYVRIALRLAHAVARPGE